jgi:hypothetical protein
MKPTPAPSKDLDPSKNSVHMLGSPFFVATFDFKFSFFFVLVGLVELTNISNLSLETMLGCTSEELLVDLLYYSWAQQSGCNEGFQIVC